MFPTIEAGVVTGRVPFTHGGVGVMIGGTVSCVIHPGKNTDAIRRTEQRAIPELRMIGVISFLKKINVIPCSLLCSYLNLK
jgi:hypothetical protein